jgi:hypothetical protein
MPICLFNKEEYLYLNFDTFQKNLKFWNHLKWRSETRMLKLQNVSSSVFIMIWIKKNIENLCFNFYDFRYISKLKKFFELEITDGLKRQRRLLIQ